MSRGTNEKMRTQLRAEKAEKEKLMLAVAEAAQREAQLQTLLERRRKENEELQRQLDFQRLRINGFQLELEARQYMLPFMKAQMDLLLSETDLRLPPHVREVLLAVQSSMKTMIEESGGQKPTLDPSSWVVLVRRLGFSPDFQRRRVPARREPVPQPEETEPTST